MVEQLSNVTVVIFIAVGALTCILLFIFAKRQIMRFALRSRRGPHVPIGHDCKKSMRKDIDRNIDSIPRIIYEPALFRASLQQGDLQLSPENPQYYRFKAVDDLKILEKEIARQDNTLVRHPSESPRAFLISILGGGPLNGSYQKLVHQFCDLYEHARYDPNEFGEEEYEAYTKVLAKLMEIAKSIKSFPLNRKTSPNRTPIKKSLEKPSLTYRGLVSDKLSKDSNEVLCVSKIENVGLELDKARDKKHETTV